MRSSVSIARIIVCSPRTFPCALLFAAVCWAQTADQQFDSAVRLQQKGDLEQARRAYEKLLTESPDRADALSNLGLIYGELGHYQKAIEIFEKALRLSPDQPSIRLNLAMTYLQAQQYGNAALEARKVASQQNSNILAHYVAGMALLKQDQLQSGIVELEIVLRAQPANIKVATTLTSAYLKAHDLQKATELVDGTLLHSDTPEAHLMVGTFYLVTGNGRDAVIQLQRAQNLDPRLTQLGSTLAEAYALTGNADTAMKMFQSQLYKDPSNFDANAFLGWLYLESRDLDKARQYLDKAFTLRPNDPGVEFQLARLARLQNNNARAAELLQGVIADQPDNAPAHVLLAEAYFKLKRIEDGKREREISNRLNAEQQARQVKASSGDR